MILLVAEHHNGSLRRSAAELVSLARELSVGSGRPVAALVMGADPAGAAAEAVKLVDSVVTVRDPLLEPPRAETFARVVGHVATELEATIVLLPDSRAATSYGPRVAVRLGGAYVEGATAVAVEGDDVVLRHTTHLARFEATVSSRAAVTIVGVAAGATTAAAPAADTGSVREIAVPIEASDTRLEVDVSESARRGTSSLAEAEVIVCGGRGLGSLEAFDRHVESLAERLNAAVGVTRPVVDAGWRSFDQLVGQTGKSVAPSLCVTLGVSGAAHFVSGVNRTKILVAVNNDAEAPIFRTADYGIVGDVREVVPALLEALPASGGS